MNKKIILTTAAVLATVATAGGVKADEFNGDLTKDSIGLTAETGNSTSATEATVSSAQGEHEGNPGNIEGDRAVDEEDPSRGSNATSFAKDGDIIRVENPEVEVTFPNGNGKYSPFEVEYKDINFPDSMAINEGDKVVTELPKEIGLQTSFDFDVYNNSDIVGKASADAQTRVITTTFNNYFSKHSLNKKMSLKFDAKWLDVVEPGKQVTVNFDGTFKTFTIAEEGPLPGDELLSKWGSQNKNDPQIINWTLRLNTARQALNNAVLSDTWSDNQEFVEGSQNIYFVEDPIKWQGIDHSAKEYLESWNVRADGFDAKFKEFNRIMYIDYQTRLKNAVKDSTNPTNKATLTANDSDSKSTSKVQLVGGRGDASGENKPEPTFEIPKESPKVEIPEFEGGIPGIPEVREKPEYTEPIGTVPNEAPMLELPELEIPDEPVKPTPEPKTDQPQQKEEPKQDKPNTPAHKNETKKETVEVVNQGEVKQNELVKVYDAPVVLPATGTDLGLSLVALGVSAVALAFILKKKEN